MYSGPPDHLHIDEGSQFVSKKFRQNGSAAGISKMAAPIESPASLLSTETYQGSLCDTFQKLRPDLLRDSPDDLLKWAGIFLSNCKSPEGLCSSLCVFGLIRKITRASLTTCQVDRGNFLENAVRRLEQHQSKQKASFEMRCRDPYGGKRDDLRNSTYAPQVLVYKDLSES